MKRKPKRNRALVSAATTRRDLALADARNTFEELVIKLGGKLAPSGKAAALGPVIIGEERLTSQEEIDGQIAEHSQPKYSVEDTQPNRAVSVQSGGAANRAMTLQYGRTPNQYIEAARGAQTPTVGFTPASPEQLREIERATAEHDRVIASERKAADARLEAELKGLIERRLKAIESGQDKP